MQRKATKQSPAANTAEKRHLVWVKNRGVCAACLNAAPLILHHCEGSSFRNNKILIGHWFVLGLCQCCDNIITRGSRKAFRLQFGSQSSLWLRQFENYVPKDECPIEVINSIVTWGR